MEEKRFNRGDLLRLALAAVRLCFGDVTGIVSEGARHIKTIILIIASALIAILLPFILIVSLPFMMIGSLTPPSEKTQPLIDLALEGISNVEGDRDGIYGEIEEWINELAGTLGDRDTLIRDVNIDICPEDIMILYNVKYGGYGEEEIDRDRVREIARLFVEKSYSEVITYEEVPGGTEEEPTVETVERRALTVTVSTALFTTVMDALELDEAQRSIALNMYNVARNNQNLTYAEGNDAAGIELGGVVFYDGVMPFDYLNQNDKRWCSIVYGRSSKIGVSGCGPTAMAMIVQTLTGRRVTPDEMAAWSYEHGYRVENNGTKYSLFYEGAASWGLTAELATGGDRGKIEEALRDGKLVAGYMGPGHFTGHGHYIVLRGLTADGKVLVGDPASLSRSEREWELSVVLSEGRDYTATPFCIIGK